MPSLIINEFSFSFVDPFDSNKEEEEELYLLHSTTISY